jgi:hypothetical protein
MQNLDVDYLDLYNTALGRLKQTSSTVRHSFAEFVGTNTDEVLLCRNKLFLPPPPPQKKKGGQAPHLQNLGKYSAHRVKMTTWGKGWSTEIFTSISIRPLSIAADWQKFITIKGDLHLLDRCYLDSAYPYRRQPNGCLALFWFHVSQHNLFVEFK